MERSTEFRSGQNSIREAGVTTTNAHMPRETDRQGLPRRKAKGEGRLPAVRWRAERARRATCAARQQNTARSIRLLCFLHRQSGAQQIRNGFSGGNDATHIAQTRRFASRVGSKLAQGMRTLTDLEADSFSIDDSCAYIAAQTARTFHKHARRAPSTATTLALGRMRSCERITTSVEGLDTTQPNKPGNRPSRQNSMTCLASCLVCAFNRPDEQPITGRTRSKAHRDRKRDGQVFQKSETQNERNDQQHALDPMAEARWLCAKNTCSILSITSNLQTRVKSQWASFRANRTRGIRSGTARLQRQMAGRHEQRTQHGRYVKPVQGRRARKRSSAHTHESGRAWPTHELLSSLGVANICTWRENCRMVDVLDSGSCVLMHPSRSTTIV